MRNLPLFVAVLVAAVTFAAFRPALSGEFLLWDDEVFLVQNQAYRGFTAEHLRFMFTDTSYGPYQPLAWLTYALDHAVWGLDAFGYHLTSLIVHALAAAALFDAARLLLPRVVADLKGRPGAVVGFAALAALLWGVHPLRVESVAWANERRDVLSALFLFLSLGAWLRYVRSDRSPAHWARSPLYWASLALFVLCLLSKATAVGWAVVLVALDAGALRRPVRACLAEKIPFLAVALPLALVAFLGQQQVGALGSVDVVPILDRVVLAAHSVWFYVEKTVVPVGLRALYLRTSDLDGLTAPILWRACLGGILTAWVILKGRRWPRVAAAGVAYLVLVAPVSGFFPIGSQLVADRFVYLAAAPLTLLAVGLAARWGSGSPSRTRWIVGCGGLCVLALAVGSWRLSRTWRTTETLFLRSVRQDPENWSARGLLATTYMRTARIDLAVREIDEALRGNPDHDENLLLATTIYGSVGRVEDARLAVGRVLVRQPEHPRAWNALGQLRGTSGDDAGAEAAFRRALRAAPRYGTAAQNLGEVFARRGDVPRAEEWLRKAITFEPDNGEARVRLGVLLWEAGRAVEGERILHRALDEQPGLTKGRAWLGDLLARDGRWKEALPHLEQADRAFAGTQVEAAYAIALAEAYAALDRPRDARAAASRARDSARKFGDGESFRRAAAVLGE